MHCWNYDSLDVIVAAAYFDPYLNGRHPGIAEDCFCRL